VLASLGRLDQLDAKDLQPLINGLQRAVGLPESMPGIDASVVHHEQLLRAMDPL